jgi:hypothetical protein
MRLLHRLLVRHPSKKEINNVFYNLEEEEYRLMKLHSHILNSNKNEYAAYHVAGLIK